jgi:hypothetical protein
MSNNPWFAPAIILAALGLSVQGIKAGWDLFMSIRTHSNSTNALRLHEVGALMNLLAGLPLAEARKAVWKVRLVKLIRDKAPMAEVYKGLEELVSEMSDVAAV